MIYIRRISLYIIGVLIVSVGVQAQQIQYIYTNDTEFSLPKDVQNEILENLESGEQILTTYFADLGYLGVSIAQRGKTFLIDTGAPFSMKMSFIEGEVLVQHTELTTYTKQITEQLIDDVLTNYVSNGYYFAEAEIVSFNVDSVANEVFIQAAINRGKLVYISGLIAEGNRLNSEDYISRISGMTDSLVANPANLNRLHQNLKQSELFDVVNAPQVRIVDDKAFVLFEVDERRLNQFDGVLGYVPDANGNGQLVGDLSLNLWSVFAEGNGIDLSYRRLEPEVSRLDARIRQYWIGSLPIGLDAGIRFFQNDTTYQHREFNLGGFYQASPHLKLISGISFEGTTGNRMNNAIEPGGNRRTASLGFDISTVNRVEVPTSGIKARVSFGVSEKTIAIDSISSGSQQHLSSYLAAYYSLSDQSVLVGRVQTFLLNGKSITDSDLMRFGGAKSMRGFSEEQVSASRVAWTDLEYRFMTNRNSYLFTFIATGYYHRPKLATEKSDQFVQTEWLQSLGFGLSYRVRVGRLSFSYAISPNSGFGNGKVHVALTTRL